MLFDPIKEMNQYGSSRSAPTHERLRLRNLRLYAKRFRAGLSIFTGEPLTPAEALDLASPWPDGPTTQTN